MTATVPIFPLNTVLYPGSMLPLRIFEQRYLDMTRDCLRDSTPFGVCRIKEGVEVGKPALPEALGCTAVIAEWEMPNLGVFHMKVRGQQRFRIRYQTTQPSGLIRAEIDLLEEVPGSTNEESLDLCRRCSSRSSVASVPSISLHHSRTRIRAG
ncbi:MAG TPA: LON peptidase substrate-binding domain-containing protein [Burkholderiales bacterium]|nr:LON peptidase substrate-binding domain-containing protein [Burkholderiales bacterium]